MTRKIITLVSSIILLPLLLVACGSDNNVADDEFIWQWDMDGNPFEGETLTFATIWRRTAMDGIITNYVPRDRRGINIEHINFYDDIERGREQVGIQFMAGNPPTLIVGSGFVDHMNPGSDALLACWLPIIQADPEFNEEGWFMDALDAFTHNGRLTAFPASIQYRHVVINSTVPGLLEAVQGRNSLSLNDIKELHRQFSPDNSMSMLRTFDVLLAVETYIDRFFDFETGRVEFNSPEFIDLITESRELTSAAQTLGSRSVDFGNMATELENGRNYLFMLVNNYALHHFDVFDNDEIVFVNPLFYVNDEGELIVQRQPHFTFFLSASASPIEQALAWDFVKSAIITSDDNILGRSRYPAHHPIHADNQIFQVYNVLQWFMDESYPSHSWQRRPGVFSEVVFAQYAAAEAMPLRGGNFAPQVVWDTMSEILGQFHDGLITAEQAANDLQNRITLILMEMN